ncbi:MAG: hypothetical protein Q8J74_06205 [Candidatus Didemnitutus sp.]|nr:hypothetical protein [Candidatus Didemnitutus sp.]
MNGPAKPPLIRERGPWVPLATALVVGGIGWMFAGELGGRKEAWDSSAYWRIAYPTFAVVAALLGYLWRRPWLAPLGLGSGQALILLAQHPTANLLPPALVALGLISAPLVLPALLGARVRRWRDARR